MYKIIFITLLLFNSSFVMYLLVATVHFNRSTYTTSESDGTVQLILVLNTPIAVDVTILIRANDITATGQ